MSCGRWSVGLRGGRRAKREERKGGKEAGRTREEKKRERKEKEKKRTKTIWEYEIFMFSKSQEM